MLSTAETIRKKLRWVTEEAGISRSALKDATGVKSLSAVSEWLRTGRVDKKHLLVFAALSHTKLEWWLHNEASIPPSPDYLIAVPANIAYTGALRAPPSSKSVAWRDTSDPLGKKLVQMMDEAGLEPAGLARIFEVKPPSVYTWIRHGRLAKKHLRQLREWSGRSLDWWFDAEQHRTSLSAPITACTREVSRISAGMEKEKPLAAIVAENVDRLMRNAPDASSGQALQTKAESKVGRSTVNRLRSPDSNPRLSTLAEVAKALGVQPWQFLIAWGIPAAPPQLAAGSTVGRAWPFSLSRDVFDRISREAKADINKYIVQQAQLEGLISGKSPTRAANG